jgi:P-type Ca2+ transporter type 2C
MEKGLTSLEAAEQQKISGKNEIKTQERISAFSIFTSQFPTFINAILVMASILSFIVGSVLDGIFILVILLINALFGFMQEYRAEKSLDKLKTYIRSVVRVLRNGKVIQLDAVDIVPGDIVLISEGDRIPADGKVSSSKFLEVDESILTGESLSVIKNMGDPIFSGTLITKGSSRFVVEKIGQNTRFGQIAKTLANVVPDKTPLQKRLDGLGKILTIVVLIIAALLIPIGYFQGKQFMPILLIAVSISIAAIPEGLPAVVTIALAIGTARMAKKKAIVRRMQSVETLGAVQIIITDKTGTLTQNIMQVKKFWLAKNEYKDMLVRGCVFGNTASLIEKKEKNSFDIIGDKTDGALLLWAHQETGDFEEIKREGKVLEEYSFDPQTSTVTTIWQNKHKHILVRGAPEVVLSKSKLTEKERKKISKIHEEYARDGYRVIGFGARISHHTGDLERKDAEKDLTFLGIVGIYDPPRLETKKAIEDARRAGIRTIMVTGDNALTASSIASEIGLLEDGDDIVTGEEIAQMSDEQLEKIILKTRIFARSKPEDKLRLVTILKKMGFVVGTTGDGVNDALALKRSDVGLAMGESGTEVAKEASDIILTDDNYSTVVSAVEEGRTIYNNILKSITYLLTGNLSELSFVFGASLMYPQLSPLLPIQILWINLVTDGLPALALASDNKDHSVLNKKPRKPNAPILENGRLIFIGIAGISISLFLLLVFKTLLDNGSSETLSRTIVFNTLIVLHLILAFIVRGKTIFKFNKFLVLGALLTLILQVTITFSPFFQQIFKLGF